MTQYLQYAPTTSFAINTRKMGIFVVQLCIPMREYRRLFEKFNSTNSKSGSRTFKDFEDNQWIQSKLKMRNDRESRASKTLSQKSSIYNIPKITNDFFLHLWYIILNQNKSIKV